MNPEELFKEVMSRKPANETLGYGKLFIYGGELCQIVNNNPKNMKVRVIGVYRKQGYDTLTKCLMEVRRDERDLFQLNRHEAAILLNYSRLMKQRAKKVS